MGPLGLVTIGQSPRPDITGSMFAGARLLLVEAGALDELARDAIDALAPVAGELPLVSRLRDGDEVTVAETRVIPLVQRAVDRLVADGASLIVILCTGEFAELRAPVPLVFPDRILTRTIDAIFPSGTLGVLMPTAGQMDWMRGRWSTATRRFVGAAVSPYTGAAELAAAARGLVDAGAELIVLDCMGFNREMKRVVAEVTGRPVVLANRLIGRVVEELIEV
jgi:protein AroM